MNCHGKSKKLDKNRWGYYTMYKGIFWLTGGELLTVKVACDESGMAHYRAVGEK